jgi:hypothetical protein
VERPHVLVEEECRVEKAPHVVDIVEVIPELSQDAPILEDFKEEEMRHVVCYPYFIYLQDAHKGESF